MNTDFLNAPQGTIPTYAWRSILYARELLRGGLKRIIGNGEQTNVWVDKWLLNGQNRRPMNIHSLIDIQLKVSQLIDPLTRNWNLKMLRDLFPRTNIQLILQQRHVLTNEDSFCCVGTNFGLYIVKSGYTRSSRETYHEERDSETSKEKISTLLILSTLFGLGQHWFQQVHIQALK